MFNELCSDIYAMCMYAYIYIFFKFGCIIIVDVVLINWAEKTLSKEHF